MFHLELEVLWVALYYYQPGGKIGIHSHDYYQIFYILDGQGDFSLESQETALIQDMLLFVKPGQMHGMMNKGNGTLKTLDIKFHIDNAELKTKLDLLSESVFSGLADIKNSLEKIREEGRIKEPLYKELSAVYLMKILILLLREGEQKTIAQHQQVTGILPVNEHDPVCEKVIHYLQENYAGEIILKEIAKLFGYTQSYICQRFRSSLHCSPLDYLHQYRIERAKELILYSDYSMKQIAEMVGVKNIHHFTRMFREMVGVAPGRWRERERGEIRKNIYISDTFINETER